MEVFETIDTKVICVSGRGGNFRYLVNLKGWQADGPFMWGKPITVAPELGFRYRTLEEDLENYEDAIRHGEERDIEDVYRRHAAGAGDCPPCSGFVTTLILSSKARNELLEILEDTGQLFPVDVEGDPFFVYNCTRLLDICDSERCEVRYGDNSPGGQWPKKISKIFVKPKSLDGEFLFKLNWPKPPASMVTVDYTKIVPPEGIYATQGFADVVLAKQLKGFSFSPVTFYE